MARREAVVTVRLSEEELKDLDALTVGQFSRSQVIRIILQDFLKKEKKEQQRFLSDRLFR